MPLADLLAIVEAGTEETQSLCIDTALRYALDHGWIDRKTWKRVWKMSLAGAHESVALTLVPDGENHWPWVQISTVNPNNPAKDASAALYTTGIKSFNGHAATPALALVAACLKARMNDE